MKNRYIAFQEILSEVLTKCFDPKDEMEIISALAADLVKRNPDVVAELEGIDSDYVT
jgi:hypothetical protein